MKNFSVYRSSAGSGKTYNLAINYISIALGNASFQKNYFKRILAITFTNKAAKEMKERILHYLNMLSNEKDIENILFEIKKKTQLSDKLVFKFSKELYSHIIHNYSDLGIQTIDKFTYKIVKSFSRELDINSDFELELDSQKIIQPVVALLLNKVSDQNKLLSDILVDFTLQKIEDGNNYNIQEDLEDFCKHFFIEGSENKLLKNTFSIKESRLIQNDLFKKRNTCKERINFLQKEVVNYFSINNLTEQHFIRGTYFKLFTIKLLSDNYKDWMPSSSLIKNIENDVWYKNSLDENLKLQLDRCKLDLIRFSDELAIILKDFITYNSILNKIYPTIIINELLAEINIFKKENNVEHISSFNRKIHNIVTTQVSAFIFERLGERYNHFLIDEFQDTSILQWQNLLPLITDTLDYGKSIVVGDGKQSIYRWRSGEVQQFLKLPQIYKGVNLTYFSEWEAKLSNHFQVENLLENYRSRKNIIQFNNSFFSQAKNILSKDLLSIYNNSEQKFSHAKDGGYVSINLFEEEVYNEKMLLQTLTEINQLVLKFNYKYNDIAILCNTHKEIEIIADFLSINKIPLISNEGLLLAKSLKIQLIISVLEYLQNNDDDLIKASILSSLYKLNFLKVDLHDLFLKVKRKTPLSTILKDLGYELNVSKISEKSLFEVIHEIINCFNISKDIFVDFFMDLVHSYTIKRISSISGFLNYWLEVMNKKSIVISEEINAVRLMTIHKSKGLAFPVVFIPFNWKSSPKKNMWAKNNNEISEKLQFSLISQNKNLSNSHFADQYHKEKSLMNLDSLNKLYVACTRAKDALYVFSPSTKKAPVNTFNMNSFFSVYSNNYPYILGEKNINKKNKVIQENVFFKKEVDVNNWRDKLTLKNTSSDFWDLDNPQEKKDWGKLLHFTLSKIHFQNQKDEVIEDVYKRGFCNITEKKRLLEEINHLFVDPEISSFFSKDWQVKTEKEILLQSGKTYIPDRILFKNNEVLVIDYKTGKIDKEHKQQIVSYSNALKNMGYQNISLYLIYTSQEKKVHKI